MISQNPKPEEPPQPATQLVAEPQAAIKPPKEIDDSFQISKPL